CRSRKTSASARRSRREAMTAIGMTAGRTERDELAEIRVNPVRARAIIVAKRVVLFTALVMLWEYSVRAGWVDPYFTSQPSEIFATLVEWTRNGDIVQHVPITIIEAALGFLIGTAVGGVAGFIFGWW